ncbi:DNA-binding of Mlu1-box binding protein MBP1 [Venustampulla echinocandica]|uniref:DNA-binding of Mlu1-box binding protein MBP1 n=1 Tax=Venustampulla echinocandica TaxID=2656787 RepID=A0A370TTW7_9HELO|nr:DNA-binding of Mlu1-box binding protein MBP1 [Venustampulla echinocandica]RDL38938.1 DNA-binding of Mlu1-box binding protein MBP1 [Venustampulla echinocandica]
MVKPTVPGVYSATYSNIPVYEYQFGEGLKEHVMRRRHDDWINATHILKAAGFDKPARTRILEREVQKENHEKVQGGYGKYQGTWVSLEQGEALAQRNNVYEKLRPIFEFTPGNISPPPAPKHTTNKPKAPKKPAVPKWGSKPVAPARVVEDDYDNISAQLNDDESVADDTTVASASFMAEDDRYDISQASTGHRKRKREEQAQNALDQAHLSYADELLDYFMTSNLAMSAPRPEPPLNFQPDWIIDQDGHSALHWAAAMGDVDVVRQLKRFGANLAAKNARAETPLMRAVLFTNCKDKQTMPQVVHELLGTIEATDFCQATVLHHAAASTVSLTKHRAARYYLDVILNKMQEMFEPEHIQLIIDARDVDGNTAIHIAAKHGARKCIRALMGRGARTDIINNDRITAEILIQEVNEKHLRELHQGSSSPYAPVNPPSQILATRDSADNNSADGYESPPHNTRKSKAQPHYSEAAMSVEKKVYPLIQEKFGELAKSFDEELKEKDTSEQEALRIVNTVHTELNEIRERILDTGMAADDPHTQNEVNSQLAPAEQNITSLIEQQQQLQLLSRANHEENKSNGHVMPIEDDLTERLTLAKMLGEEQGRRQTLVALYRDALAVAGDVGEMGEVYRKVIADSVDVKYTEIDDEIDNILEAMQEEELCMRGEIVMGSEV